MVTRDKILSVGAGTNSSSEGVHADAGNAVSCEAKMASAEGTLSATSSKPYGVGTPVSAEDKQCMKIIRVENASLWDLHNLFRDLIWDRDLAVPVGSCILIGSASHLGNVGSAVYAEELVQINMRLAQMFDGTIYFVPCPPMMVDGSSDPALIRGIFEIAAWLRNVMGADSCFLPNTYRVMVDLLFKRGTGVTICSYKCPHDASSRAGLYQPYEMGQW